MAETSALSLPVLEAHGTFSAASLPDLCRAAEAADIAAHQLALIVRRIRARGGDPTIAVDLVALATARLAGIERELLAAANALEGRL